MRDLGISTRSLVHHWSKAGAPGQIPGYSSYLKVQEVCRAGETEACRKIRFTESGGFVGGVAGGSAGAGVAGLGAVKDCGAIGLASGGVGGALCAILVVGGASFAGGAIGGGTGELTGEFLYGQTKP